MLRDLLVVVTLVSLSLQQGDSGVPALTAQDYLELTPSVQALAPQYSQCRYLGGPTYFPNGGGAPYLLWTVNANTVDFALVGRYSGWMGFGVSSTNTSYMLLSDIVMGTISNGEGNVDDFWAPGNDPINRIVQKDTDVGGHDNVDATSTFTYNSTTGVATMKWSRPRKKVDAQLDAAIQIGEVWTYVWAANTAYDTTMQHNAGNNWFYVDLGATQACPMANNKVCGGFGTCQNGCCNCDAGKLGYDCTLVDGNSTTTNSGLTADIVASDYTYNLQFDPAYTLYWKLIGTDEIEIAVSVKGTGWVGFGATNTGTMLQSDIFWGYVDGTGPHGTDRFITDRASGCPGVCADEQLGGTNDILAFNGSETNGVTQMKWRRKLNTNDVKADIAIVNALISVAWGYHPTSDGPAVTQHPTGYTGVGQINFITGVGSAQNLNPNKQAHGSLMFIAWSIFIPIGAFIGRYLKRYTWWFNVHRLLNSTAVLMTVAAFIIAVDFSTTHFDTDHKILGLIIVILALAQPIIGTVADRWFDPERSRAPVFPDISHWIIGWVVIAAALANISLGIDAYGQTTVPRALLVIYTIFGGLIFFFLVGYFIYSLVAGTSRFN